MGIMGENLAPEKTHSCHTNRQFARSNRFQLDHGDGDQRERERRFFPGIWYF